MGFGVVSLLNAVFTRAFTSAGLAAHVFQLDDDTTMRCWLSGSIFPSNDVDDDAPAKNGGQAAGGGKPVALLIHGFGPDATWQWAAQVGPLASHFDLVVPYLLFFGGSTTRAPHRSDVFQAECIVRLLSAAGVRSVAAIIGFSYGGMVAYQVARKLGAGNETMKVVIADADLLKSEEDNAALATRAGVENVADLMLPRDTHMMRRLIAFTQHRPPRFLPECFLQSVQKVMFGENTEERMMLMTATSTAASQVTPLSQQLLMIWGEFDQIFPLDKAMKVKQKLGGDKVQLEVIPNTGHLPQQEDPKLFNQVLFKFLLEA